MNLNNSLERLKNINTNIRAEKEQFIYDRSIGSYLYNENISSNIETITGCIRDAVGMFPECEVTEVNKEGGNISIVLDIDGKIYNSGGKVNE